MIRTARWAAWAAVLMALSPAVQAASFVVTNTGTGTGGGTLRRAIINANATSGTDTIVFNLPTSDAGYSAARGVFTFRITSALAQITESVVIDGATQTVFTGNTNVGTLGAGGSVGTTPLTLSRVNRPEIELVDGNGLALGLDISASNVTIRNLAIYGFGNVSNSDADANIRVGGATTGTLIESCIVGTSATSFTDLGAGTRSVGDNIRVVGADNGIVRNNLIGYTNGKGIELNTNADGWLIENNELRGNGINTPNLDGIDVENGSRAATIRGNLIAQNFACGVDTFASTGSNLIENNTIEQNGYTTTPPAIETPGVRVYGTGSTVRQNVLRQNFGAGVVITTNSTGNLISRNSIFGNGPTSGQIGIDLNRSSDDPNQGTAPYVTINDAGDTDTGGNGLLNFAVFTSASISGTQLTLKGFARPGSALEIFAAAVDPSGFGEGQTYLATLTEGSAQDTDTSTGTYTSPVNGLNVGTDTTNRFTFVIVVPPSVAVNSVLCATATVSGNTSEFSNNINVTLAVTPAEINLAKTVTPTGNQPPGTSLTYSVSFTNVGGSAATGVVLQDVVPGNTDFRVGSASAALGTTGMTVAYAYSNDGGATYTYTPASGAGGAPAGFDRTVTNVRWTLTGSLSQTAPNNTGSIGFVARIR
ncbi:MAG: right-handed parallel beta-helix repeat-containing protein [Acidobacteriota bacterium]